MTFQPDTYHQKKITDSILIDDFVILNDAPELKIFLLHIWRAIALQNLVFMENGSQPDESPFTLQQLKNLVSIKSYDSERYI